MSDDKKFMDFFYFKLFVLCMEKRVHQLHIFFSCSLRKVQPLLKALQPKLLLVIISTSIDIFFSIHLCKILIHLTAFVLLFKTVSEGLEVQDPNFRSKHDYSLLWKWNIMHAKLQGEHRNWYSNRFSFPVPLENIEPGNSHEAGRRAFHGSRQTSVTFWVSAGRLQATQTIVTLGFTRFKKASNWAVQDRHYWNLKESHGRCWI